MDISLLILTHSFIFFTLIFLKFLYLLIKRCNFCRLLINIPGLIIHLLFHSFDPKRELLDTLFEFVELFAGKVSYQRIDRFQIFNKILKQFINYDWLSLGLDSSWHLYNSAAIVNLVELLNDSENLFNNLTLTVVKINSIPLFFLYIAYFVKQWLWYFFLSLVFDFQIIELLGNVIITDLLCLQFQYVIKISWKSTDVFWWLTLQCLQLFLFFLQALQLF